MKLTVFWEVAECSLIEINRRFRGAVSIIRVMMKAVITYGTSVNFCGLHGVTYQETAIFFHIFSKYSLIITLALDAV
jgi:hypothetical protein